MAYCSMLAIFGMKGGEVEGLRFGGGFENSRDTNFKNWCPLYINKWVNA